MSPAEIPQDQKGWVDDASPAQFQYMQLYFYPLYINWALTHISFGKKKKQGSTA